MLCLNIRSTQPQIGLNVNHGVLDMKSRDADIQVEEHRPATVGIWPDSAVIEVDAAACRDVYADKRLTTMMREYAQKGLQALQEYTAKQAQIGTQFLKSGHKVDVPAMLAKQSVTESSNVEIGLANVPAPIITVRNNKMQGRIDPGSFKLKITEHPVENNYTPTTVKSYIEQQGSIRMWVTEGKYDIYA